MRPRHFAAALVAVTLLTGSGVWAQAPNVESFPKVRLNIQEGEKKKEIDAIVRHEADGLTITDKKGATLKKLTYAEIKSAEYSYSKSPRYKAAIFVSPLFLFTSGKKHWLMLQGERDYALMQLDKSNYRLVLASFEAKSGKKVETAADSK